MNNDDALANLKPLITPEPITWWPPAPGWWVLGAILLVALVCLTVWGWKRWRHYRGTRYQREALLLLSAINQQEPGKQLQEVATILRRATICAWGREQAGTKNWQDIIDMSCTGNKRNISPALDESSVQLLTESLYRRHEPSTESIEVLKAQAVIWLKTLPAVGN